MRGQDAIWPSASTAPSMTERQALMPVQKAHPVKEVLDIIKAFDFGRQRRVSFEYIVFKGLNDTPGPCQGAGKDPQRHPLPDKPDTLPRHPRVRIQQSRHRRRWRPSVTA
ncbi:MAG: hypothetical protein MZV63_02765 [Marinilabiliales bacterium]|nr:hypothetical protein [Marinilabiliales bacterium]